MEPKADDPRGHDAAPALHNVPSDIIPLMQSKGKKDDFFCDLTPENDPRRDAQVAEIVEYFPPPVPPEAPDHDAVQIPFIWPPPPVVNPDTLPYSLSQFKTKLDRFVKLSKLDRGRTGSRKGKEDGLRYVLAPPLPFPPANFMPYPLQAHLGSLTPAEVFRAMLDANDNLPRIDMVVASAAGSLADINNQVAHEGFDRAHFDAVIHQRIQEAKARDSHEADFGGIDTRDYVDELAGPLAAHRDWTETEAWARVQSKPSYARKRASPSEAPAAKRRAHATTTVHATPSHAAMASSHAATSPLAATRPTMATPSSATPASATPSSATPSATPAHTVPGELEPAPATTLAETPLADVLSVSRDITYANGMFRERRRRELVAAANEINAFHDTHAHDLFCARKHALQQRLHGLQQSRIGFGDTRTGCDDLARYHRTLSLERDDQLVRLKLGYNYEVLKASSAFYQDSHRVYRDYVALMTNKLGKLRHFFEYQQRVGAAAMAAGDIYDLKTKESTKLYQGTSTADYGAQIKHILKHPTTPSPRPFTPDGSTSDDDKQPTPKQKLDDGGAFVHDYMPLITPSEFATITGDSARQSKQQSPNKQNASLKHQIFQSPLYDANSGSDTNISDSSVNAAGLNRRGRRTATPGPTQGPRADGVAAYSTSALYAKIMKQFSGPQMATADEYHADLDTMGIASAWPRRDK
ncbi:hypothetical protein DICA1_B11650 [Diutina catenulata]